MNALLCGRLFERARVILSRLFADAAGGCIDTSVLDGIAHPVIRALQADGLQGWLVAVHAQGEHDTIRHSLHVAGLAAHVGHHLGLSVRTRATLVRAGLLHDIGKARIPAAILDKPGALTAAEMAAMRGHAAIGHEILLASGMRDPVVLAVTRHHHEMLDGSGYPDRLADDAIGNLVRLTTVCDIYAALTERRPYRAGMTRADALATLWNMAPHRLDPALVRTLEASLDAPRPMTASRPIRPFPSLACDAFGGFDAVSECRSVR